MFTEEDRKVFKYNDGAKDVFADPLDLRRKMVRATNGELDLILEEYAMRPTGEGGKATPTDYIRKATAEERLAAAARETFSLQPLNPATGEGVTDRMAIKVFIQLDEHLEGNE